MKKLLASAPITLLLAGMAHGQGLYDIAPNEEAKESSPISWSAGISYNFDDNVTPTEPKVTLVTRMMPPRSAPMWVPLW